MSNPSLTGINHDGYVLVAPSIPFPGCDSLLLAIIGGSISVQGILFVYFALPMLASILLCVISALLGAIRRHERERVGDARSMAFLCGWVAAVFLQSFLSALMLEGAWMVCLDFVLPTVIGGVISYKMARYLVATNIS